MSDETLRQEIAELRRRLDEAEDWANGIQLALIKVLPVLLRGHPEAHQVERLLREAGDRFDTLQAHPERAEHAGETAGLYEAGKMLYWQLALLGVWPGIAPDEAARQSLARVERAKHKPR